MILRHLSWRGRLMLAICVFLIAGQVYLDLRIPEYMGVITDHLQAGTATDVIARDGAAMVVCALLSLLLAACTAVLAARVSADLCHTLRRLLFSSVGAFSRQDVDGFSASSLITRSTNDVYQIQQFLPRAINMVVKAPMIGIMAVIVCHCGVIGFVGLMIPHIARGLVGTNHWKLLPVSILLGAIFMMVADVAARSLSTSEIPIGIITAICGAPVFAYIMLKKSYGFGGGEN